MHSFNRRLNSAYLSFSRKIWRFAAKIHDFSMACKIARDAADAQTESLTGQGSPGCDRQILHEKDGYPEEALTTCVQLVGIRG
jgi:hypothetical protein